MSQLHHDSLDWLVLLAYAADPDLELLLLAATILAEHDHQDLAAQVVARGLVASPSNQALLSLQRTLERSP